MHSDKTKTFKGLVLDETTLTTPEGSYEISELTRAEFVRDVERDGTGPSTMETSGGAVAGGAVIGGVLLGPVGAVGGAMLGSTVKNEEAGAAHFSTKRVQLIFETDFASFSMDIAREDESAAYEFSRDVQHAMKKAHKH